jgi:hypothetical protein
MWQGLQNITDYKGKTSHVADTDILLLEKLNAFLAYFENNTVPPTRPAPKDCGLSFSVADLRKTLNMFSLARLPASLPSSSEHAQTCMAGMFTVIFNPYTSLLSPLASICPPLFL